MSDDDEFLLLLAHGARLWAHGTEAYESQAMAETERAAPAHRRASRYEWPAAFAILRILQERLSSMWSSETDFRFQKMAEIATGRDGPGTARARVYRVAGNLLYQAHIRTDAAPWKPVVVRVRRGGEEIRLRGDCYREGDEVLESWTAGELIVGDAISMNELARDLERLRDLSPGFAALSLDARAPYRQGHPNALQAFLLRALQVERSRPRRGRPRADAARSSRSWEFAMGAAGVAAGLWQLAGMPGPATANNFDMGLRKRAQAIDRRRGR